MKTRVVLVCKDVVSRLELIRFMDAEGSYEVVGEAQTGFEGVKICRELKPQLVILDLLPGEMGAPLFVRILRSQLEGMRFVAYVDPLYRELTAQTLHVHPNGIVAKDDSMEVLREALGVVATGFCFCSPTFSRYLEPAGSLPHFNDLERAVLQMIAEGMSNLQMADLLAISVPDVEHQGAQIMIKLNLDSVAAVVRYAIRRGIVTPEA